MRSDGSKHGLIALYSLILDLKCWQLRLSTLQHACGLTQLSLGQTIGFPTELILRVQNHKQQAHCPQFLKKICYFKLVSKLSS